MSPKDKYSKWINYKTQKDIDSSFCGNVIERIKQYERRRIDMQFYINSILDFITLRPFLKVSCIFLGAIFALIRVVFFMKIILAN